MNADEIGKIVKADIQAKIIEAFRSTPEMIDQLVAACLSREVNEHGMKPSYNDNKMPYLTYLAQETIEGVATQAVREYITTMAPLIKNKVKHSLSSETIVNAFSKTIIESTKREYDIKVEFVEKKEL